MAHNPLTGSRCLLRGFQLLTRPGLRRYVIVPVLVNLILFAALIGFGASEFGHLVDWLLSFLPGWLDWLRYLLWPLFAVTAALVTFFTFALVANFIAAPFNGLLAEAVERQLTGQSIEQSGGWTRALAETVPALLGELRKLGYFLLWAIPLGILFLIPVVNLAAPFLWAAFSAWMFAIEYMDYPMGNHGLAFPRQRDQLRAHRGSALGFGASVLVATLIPVVNFVVMPAAVAGATALWVERFRGQV